MGRGVNTENGEIPHCGERDRGRRKRRENNIGFRGMLNGDGVRSGGWKVPETDVPVVHCSGKYPGWSPSQRGRRGGDQDSLLHCEQLHLLLEPVVRVKNCISYFVYQLWPSPHNYAVYCTATDSALGDPCLTHTVLDQPWRSTDCSNTECSRGTWMDDGNLAVGWYRFNSSGGWKIPETVLPGYHCSGLYPGWLTGPHPSVGDGEVTRTVCFTSHSNICYMNREIRVKNCTGYFVYQLWPSAYYHAYALYCTGRSPFPSHTGSHPLVWPVTALGPIAPWVPASPPHPWTYTSLPLMETSLSPLHPGLFTLSGTIHYPTLPRPCPLPLVQSPPLVCPPPHLPQH
ncbi:uromodulin-like [Amblyraja radiata]|uniref:uromodulin-like n=1 Tax=Amblyraja radiata TaxID=386614 RepID=UPI0014023B66|nr:uromodulin-like [Amblyraja radiata]